MVPQVNASESDRAPASGAPATLTWAVRLLLTEAAALALLTGYLVVEDFTAEATDLGVALALTGFAALSAVGVAALARALWRRSAGARGPAVVVQLMLLLFGYYLSQAGLWWLGGPLLVLGLATGVLVLAPATTRALGLR